MSSQDTSINRFLGIIHRYNSYLQRLIKSGLSRATNNNKCRDTLERISYDFYATHEKIFQKMKFQNMGVLHNQN